MKSFTDLIVRGWNWLVFSCADPSKIALTVKGFGSLVAVHVIVSNVLPAVGVHLKFDLNTFADTSSTVVYFGAIAVSAVAGAIGAGRKLLSLIQGKAV